MRLPAQRVVELRMALSGLVSRPSLPSRVHFDPVGIVRRYQAPDDREVAALIAAALAYGRVTSLRAKVARLLDLLSPSPARTVREATPDELARRVEGFVHRLSANADIVALLGAIASAYRRHGSLHALFISGYDAEPTIEGPLSRFVAALRGSSPTPGLAFLLSSPADGSACKRMNLFLRWVVRPDDGVDLGLWPDVDRARLVIPLDTHVARISRAIRLTRRRTPNWATALDVTDSLRRIDPTDPCRFDFALSHLGISGEWARRRDRASAARPDLLAEHRP